MKWEGIEMDLTFKQFVQKYRHGSAEIWLYIDGWKSDTVEGLEVVDLGVSSIPKSRATTVSIPGRDGYVIQKNSAFDGEVRELVFFAKHKKALHRLYGKIQTGQEYTFIFSNDTAHQQTGFVKDMIPKKLTPEATEVRIKIQMQPFKEARQTTTFQVKNNLEIVNIGDRETQPIMELVGTGLVRMELGERMLEVEFGQDEKLVLDSHVFQAKDQDGNFVNQKLKKGFFLEIPEGRSLLKVTGQVTGTITVNWRYRP